MPGNYGLYIDKSTNPMSEASLQFNGLERINRDAAYYNYIHPLNHHTRSPPDGLNVFSFALTPEDKQPSGSCNFSRLDAAVLSMLFKNADISNDDMRAMFGNDTQIDIMAFSYNVLRILSGMGGLAYSN
jgi:hypothetical protein